MTIWIYIRMMEMALKQLHMLVNNIAHLSDADWEVFSALWQPVTAKRKQIITDFNGPEPYLYFVVSGVQRIYYIDDQGREATLLFTYSPSFGGVIDAMMLKKSSKYCYEALTASVLLRAPYSNLESLMKENEAISALIREGVAVALSGLLERLVELQIYSSEEKLTQLLRRSPHILQLVPHKYLANYLGIDPTNFSKLMNKKLW